MSREKDLLDMLEIFTTAIEIHGREEDFFRRSSKASTHSAAKSLLLHIADDIGHYRRELEKHREEVKSELDSLETPGRKSLEH